MKVAEIWRFPVKSMQGERLEQASVGPGGIEGDRWWAVVDAESGVSLSAKRYPALLHCHAKTEDDGIMMTLPDGHVCRPGSAEAAERLTELLGRNVTTRSADDTETIQHEFPTAVTEGKGDPFLYRPKTQAFFDCAPLQLLTSASMNELQRLLPDSNIHRDRFRPNFLVETDSIGFIEHDWVNKEIDLGPVRCQVYDDTRRCIMVALDQGELTRDTAVIRTIVKRNAGRAGVALRAMESGVVHCGADVEVLAEPGRI